MGLRVNNDERLGFFLANNLMNPYGRKLGLSGVYIADEMPLFCEGVARIVEQQPDLKVTGVSTSVEHIEKNLRRSACDILVLDADLWAKWGDGYAETFPSYSTGTCVLMLSLTMEPALVRDALDAGARGWLSKWSSPRHLVDAIRGLLAGRTYIDSSIAYSVISESQGAASVKLTRREADVLLRILNGASNGDIARELCLSEKTISSHKSRIMDKLNVSSLVELIRYVDRHPELIKK